MTTSIKIKFKPSEKGEKEGHLFFQIIHNRMVKLIPTNIRIMPDEWDSSKQSIKLQGNRITFLVKRNQQLLWMHQRLKRVIFDLGQQQRDFSVDDIANAYHQISIDNSLCTFTSTISNELKRLGHERTSETYLSALHSFINFRNGDDVPLDGIDEKMISLYEVFLKRKGVSMNTVSFYMRILRAIYNKAIEKGLTDQKHPFRHVYTGIDKTVKRALPLEKMHMLKSLDLTSNPYLSYARDLFLFSFYTRGMAFIDMAYLKKNNVKDGMLIYKRQKTGQQLVIRWEKCMQNIIDDHHVENSEYLLPIITSDYETRKQYRNAMRLINYHLKNIAKIIDEPRLTMYVARHTWASVAKQLGIPISIISEGLGHDSESTTKIYLAALDNSIIDEANKKILEVL